MSLIDSVKTNPSLLEDQIVSAFISSRKFFVEYSETLLDLASVIKNKSKFTNYNNRIIFSAICEIRNRVHDDVVPKALLCDFINSAVTKGELFENEQGPALSHIESLYTRVSASTAEFVRGDLYDTWFNAGLVEDIVTLANTSDNVLEIDDLEQKIGRIKQVRDRKENKTVTVMSSIQNEAEIAPTIPSGIPKLDHNLGGGFRCGESTLIAASTGGGKTVMACQLAGQFANMGRKTVFVTTEQPPRELTPRFLSNQCSIPFNVFTDHVSNQDDVTTIPAEVRNNREYNLKMMSTLSILNDSIRYVDWSGGDGKSIERDLDVAVDAVIDDPNDPFDAEIVIFDWLGGALKKDANKDLRIMYLDGAEHLHNLAKRRGMAVIFFAQLNKVKSRNKLRCDSSMLAECTSTPDKASNALYISSVRSEEGDSSYNTTQMINVDKARKGPMGTLSIIRDFKHQRFVSPSMINSI